MISLSLTEENYLKAIYHLSDGGQNEVATNAIADHLETKPASVTDMIKKLAQKKVVNYQKYQGVNLSEVGMQAALMIIRKHRLWEVFLLEKLNFSWDEVHDVAEQLEHIKSPLLIQRLDIFLGHPSFDPHGDPIPDEKGIMPELTTVPLKLMEHGAKGKIVSVSDSSSALLRYLEKIGAVIGAHIEVLEREEFDGSLEVKINHRDRVFISEAAAHHILVTTV